MVFGLSSTLDTVCGMIPVPETTKLIVKCMLKMCIFMDCESCTDNVPPSCSFYLHTVVLRVFDSQFYLCSSSSTRQFAPPDVDTEEAHVTALSVDRLALLGRIHLARVIIESLRISLESNQITPRKKGLMGKPPRPASVNKW